MCVRACVRVCPCLCGEGGEEEEVVGGVCNRRGEEGGSIAVLRSTIKGGDRVAFTL